MDFSRISSISTQETFWTIVVSFDVLCGHRTASQKQPSTLWLKIVKLYSRSWSTTTLCSKNRWTSFWRWSDLCSQGSTFWQIPSFWISLCLQTAIKTSVFTSTFYSRAYKNCTLQDYFRMGQSRASQCNMRSNRWETLKMMCLKILNYNLKSSLTVVALENRGRLVKFTHRQSLRLMTKISRKVIIQKVLSLGRSITAATPNLISRPSITY